MSGILSIIMSYVEIFLLLTAVCVMIVIFIKCVKKNRKLEWFSRAIVVTLLLIVSIIDMFLKFTENLGDAFNNELIIVVSQFISTIMSLFFLSFVLGKRHILKFL
ncbi:MAG: hypothetical protein JW791_01930 [Nanoarchaeota archaeon]|nr:hypothetical protein [Nanoarchaeota archaeon]